MMARVTTFSPCRRYRYTLWREWDLPRGLPYGTMDADGFNPLPLHAASEFCMFIGLNPSTADEMVDDPTIRRCVGFAKAWGFGALCMTNLFALRATNPREMMETKCPVGESNLLVLLNCATRASLIVAAWGAHGGWMDQDRVTVNALARISCPPISCLGVTKCGFPSHPLYMPRDSRLGLFQFENRPL